MFIARVLIDHWL